jgi:hypothetical protein
MPTPLKTCLSQTLLLLLALTATPAVAAPKKAPPKAPAKAPAKTELKPAPADPPPSPAPTASPPPQATPAPIAQTAAPVPAPPPEVAAPAAESAKGASGLSLHAAGGVALPVSAVLGVGGRGEVQVLYFLGQVPLGFSLGVAFEQHTAVTSAIFAPPQGGYDAAGIINQTLLPVQVGVHAALFRDENNRVQLGASYAGLVAWSNTQALGQAHAESGLGHEFAAEAGYAHQWGKLELLVRARYGVRHTAVGAQTATMELPWYQTASLLVGFGLWL